MDINAGMTLTASLFNIINIYYLYRSIYIIYKAQFLPEATRGSDTGNFHCDLESPCISSLIRRFLNMFPRLEIRFQRFKIRLCDHNVMFYRVLLGIGIIILLEISCDLRDSRQDLEDSKRFLELSM